jgi:hypothetical protein
MVMLQIFINERQAMVTYIMFYLPVYIIHIVVGLMAGRRKEDMLQYLL